MQGNPEIKKAKWSKEEDERLMELMQEHKGAWALIARHLPGRTDQQCMVGLRVLPAERRMPHRNFFSLPSRPQGIS